MRVLTWPSGSLAQGGMIVIKGSNLGPNPLQIINSFPLRTELAGTTVKATVAGTAVDAYLVYTSGAQVAAILPSGTPTGPGTLTVSYNGQTSGTAPIRVVTSAFGIFTLNEAGSGPGIFQNANSGTDQPVNTLTTSARPGQLAIIWGTGLGPATRDERVGEASGDLAVNVEVYVGGKPAAVTYKGRSGCCAGIDQIVFTVPSGVEGCYVPVVVKTGNVVSNFVSMSISGNGAACSEPNGLSGAQLQTAQGRGEIRIGGISLTRSVTKISVAGQSFETKMDAGAGYFSRFDLNQMLRSQGLGNSPMPTVMGSCTVFSLTDTGSQGAPVDVIQPTALDAGNITVEGPRGAKQLTRESGAYYATLSSGTPSIPGLPGGGGTADFLEPGAYRILGTGGAGTNSIGPFSVNLNIHQLLNWTNMDATETVTRSNDLPITWSGGDPNGFVYIYGMSAAANNASAMFYCTERASAQRFSVPSYVLSTLPATVGQNIGFLAVHSMTQPVTFTADRLDIGTVSASSGSQKTVTYR